MYNVDANLDASDSVISANQIVSKYTLSDISLGGVVVVACVVDGTVSVVVLTAPANVIIIIGIRR